MDTFLFDAIAKLDDRCANGLYTGIQLKRFLDFTNRDVRAFLDQLVDRFDILLCQLGLAPALIQM